MENKASPPLAYNVEEAADVAHISRAYLYEMLQQGTGPSAKKIGRRTIILHEDLMAWLRAMPDYKPSR